MTTAAPSTALSTIQPAFTDPERLALAGFLAGYRGLTRGPTLGACPRGCRRLAALGTGRVRARKRGCDERRREQAARPQTSRWRSPA
jgi:hypothetical protein